MPLKLDACRVWYWHWNLDGLIPLPDMDVSFVEPLGAAMAVSQYGQEMMAKVFKAQCELHNTSYISTDVNFFG